MARMNFIFRLMICGALAGGLCGCNLIKALYEPNPQPAPKSPIADEAKAVWEPAPAADGSIWSAGTVNFFADDKALRKGDILMVKIVHDTTGSMSGNTDTKRSSKISAKIKYMLGLEDSINNTTGYTDYFKTLADQSPGAWDPNDLLNAESESEFSGEGSTKRTDKLAATISAVVTDVLSNGNLVVYGNQTVTVNNEASVLTVQGIVRPSDVADDNIIDSRRMANAQIDLKPSGVINDNQHPGWAMRAFTWVWPF